MTPQPQHPQRCETCERFPCDAIKEASKTISSVVISEMLQSLLKDFTALVGCASHTSAGAQQQRIVQKFRTFIEDVSHLTICSCKDGFEYRMIPDGYIQEMIALLQEGDQG